MNDQPTLLNLLTTALTPCGHTLYVWGGGWNAADTGAGRDALTLGENPQWRTFFEQHAKGYDYHDHRFSFGNGLDCSGFTGWVLYNTLEKGKETSFHKEGYVTKSSDMAQLLAVRGLGRFLPKKAVDLYLPGDIVSIQGHVFLSLGTCTDGSILLLHSSPQAGVQISGTIVPGAAPPTASSASGSTDAPVSQAWQLADTAMRRWYPECHALFGTKLCGEVYLTGSVFRWDLHAGPLSDPEALALLPPEMVLNRLLPPDRS